MDSKDIIDKYSHKLWGLKDISAIDEYFSEDCIIHSPLETIQGKERMKEIIQEWFQGFPNLIVTWDDQISENNKVVSRWHATCKHEGIFLGHPATNKKVQCSGTTIYALDDNKISEYWKFVNLHLLLNQITS